MNPRKSLVAISTLLLLSSGVVQAHEPADKLGKLTFPTSCDAKVQAEFESGVAMLHSYWFNYAGKTFQSVLQKDPNCAMAYWGIALDLLGNSLSSPPSAERRASGLGGAGEGARDRRENDSASATGSRRSAPTTVITTKRRSMRG